MNRNIIQGNWRQIKGKLKQQWGKFTDNEINEMEGTYDELAGALQEKYGYDEDRSEKEIETFVIKNKIAKERKDH